MSSVLILFIFFSALPLRHRHRRLLRAPGHGAGRPSRRRPRQGLRVLERALRDDLGQRRGERDGRRGVHHPDDEAGRLRRDVRGGRRGDRLHRRADHAADHGGRRVHHGRPRRRPVPAGGDRGGDPRAPLLLLRLHHRALRGAAPQLTARSPARRCRSLVGTLRQRRLPAPADRGAHLVPLPGLHRGDGRAHGRRHHVRGELRSAAARRSGRCACSRRSRVGARAGGDGGDGGRGGRPHHRRVVSLRASG